MPKKKKCVVGYKTAVMGNGWVYGQVFSKLDACCKEFEEWFKKTGNTKSTDFNSPGGAPYDEQNGFNFVTRGKNLEVELRLTDPFKVGTVKFCHSCGAKIEIKEVARVALKPRQKQVSDGYEEILIPQKGA